MSERCPVCGQDLPKGMDQADLHERLDKIREAAAKREAARVRDELESRHRRQLAERTDGTCQRE